MKYLSMRRGVWIFLSCIFTALAAGCFYEPEIPDQSQFKSVDEMAGADQAVARVYASSVLGPFAFHTWILVKSADSTKFDRWEVWPDFWEGTSVIRKNMRSAETHFGSIFYIVAEEVGSEAQAVKDVVESSRSNYPYMAYDFVNGPNCNTYTQWVADQAGWDIELPDAAVGKDY
jgi:hypothetical protein